MTGEPDWPNTHDFVPAMHAATMCTQCGVVVKTVDAILGLLPDPECPKKMA